MAYRGESDKRRELRSENLELGNIKEDVLYCPDVKSARRLNRSAVFKSQLVGIVVEVVVRVGESRIGHDAGVQAVLARLILAVLLRHQR